MPDRRRHRGPHGEDPAHFGPSVLPDLRRAAHELGWLLDRRYSMPSALKLVGDRHGLVSRQRLALQRCLCDAEAARHRRARQLTSLAGQSLWIDGYNVLITLEAALAGGLLLQGRDGALRDLASLHGTFRRVAETLPALELLGDAIARSGAASTHWLFDQPVSNSGRLRSLLLDLASERRWNISVSVVPDVDRQLAQSPGVVATSDSAVLDAAQCWFPLARNVIDASVPGAWIVVLDAAEPPVELTPPSR